MKKNYEVIGDSGIELHARLSQSEEENLFDKDDPRSNKWLYWFNHYHSDKMKEEIQ